MTSSLTDLASTNPALTDLGWSPFFADQFADHLAAIAAADAIDGADSGSPATSGLPLTPFRIIEVHRAQLTGFGASGANILTTPHETTGSFAVGDWVLADTLDQVQVRLTRTTELNRRAAGNDARIQLIAANVDTIYITTSCNADFNPARLERYLALAQGANCTPVVLMTKADLSDSPADFAKQAAALAPDLIVMTVNTHDADDLARIAAHCPLGKTAVLVGSSGVGKTTLMNGLTGSTELTQGIREDDAKGRHTTTARTLRRMHSGGCLIDTPGIRSLRLLETDDGIDTVFADLHEISTQCRFFDCGHNSEPGCAIRAALKEGTIDADRLQRWTKLQLDESRNNETLAQSRSRSKGSSKMIKTTQRAAKHRKAR
jgi:ribosome biogenesis GTPase